MRSSEERIRLMHRRADSLRREKDKRILAGAGSAGLLLLAGLLVCLVHLQGLSEGYGEGAFSASSLLSQSTGGYVLVAVVFFMLGVLITVFLMRHQKTKHHLDEEAKNSNHEEGRRK